MRPSQVPYSQHAFGNAAVQRPLAGRASSFADKAANNSPAREPAPTVQRKPNGITVQRRAWNNEPAKFRTENELGAPNSEYDVTATGYRRFAPVNIWRDAYDQVYYDRHDRSFMYLRREDVQDETFEFLDAKARVDTVASGRVTLRRAEDRMLSSADRMLSSALRTLTNLDTIEKLVGDIAPSEGKVPLDFTIRETGAMDAGWHIGHSVTELRRPLPILDNPEILAEVLEELERLRRGDPIVNRDTMKAAIIARYAGHGLRIIHPRQVPGGPPSRQVYGGPDVQGPAAAAGLSAHAGCGP